MSIVVPHLRAAVYTATPVGTTFPRASAILGEVDPMPRAPERATLGPGGDASAVKRLAGIGAASFLVALGVALGLGACSRELDPGPAGSAGSATECGPDPDAPCGRIEIEPTDDATGTSRSSDAVGAGAAGGTGGTSGGAGGSGTGGTGGADASMDAAVSMDADTTMDANGGAGGAGGTGGASGAGGAGGASGAGGAGGAAGAGGAGGTTGSMLGCDPGSDPVPTLLPTAQDPCPTLTEGDHTFLGMNVRIWTDPANTDCGPLLFYWHGTGGSPAEATYFTSIIDAVKGQGGMVASFDASSRTCSGCTTTGNNVWYYEDFAVADEVLACAVEQGVIDTRRIHATGFSAGGLQATAMSYARSRYLASVVTLSGGVIILTSTTSQDSANKFAAMIVHGGTTDSVGGVSFKSASETYRSDLQGEGHFAFLCNHDMGHTVPTDIISPMWQFFQDHRYKATPSPYAAALPGSFPGYCGL